MQYLLTESEYNKLKAGDKECERLLSVAQQKEERLTEVGLILHDILGTECPPKLVNGMDCVALARRVQSIIKSNQ